VLNALDAAIGVIRGGNTTANDPATRHAAGCPEGVDQSMDQVSTKISSSVVPRTSLRRSTPIGAISARPTRPRCSSIRKLNYSTAAVQLKSLISAVKATQAAYGKVSQLSLFDAL
jgi:flagellar hook-associated protein 3 FlgL